MSEQSFFLRPFGSASPLPSLELTGSIARRAHRLAISYEMRGQLAEVVIAAPAERPARRQGLWEATCFEFFLAVKEARRYWEFNLSPAGHWNVYGFERYRQGRREERAFAALPFRVRSRPDSLRLALEVELERIVRADQALAVAIAAVVKLREGGVSYYALRHGGEQPDFHRREDFLVEL